MNLRVIDSHTGGEPTRLVVEGLPDIPGSVADRLAALRDEFDWVRTSLCLEPRGTEVAIGAAVFPPSREGCIVDVVFFNNTSYLGMCGHGTIGVMASLTWLGKSSRGQHRINTVAGEVSTEIFDANTVSFENVPAFRSAKGVGIDMPGFGPVTGDIAYGGNWFYLVKDGGPSVRRDNIPLLMDFTSAVMDTLESSGITGNGGARIDHVEVFGPSTVAGVDSKNFVLCPGKQYDRSPCGTGTCAKLACLVEDGLLKPGQTWRQESIIGSVFEGSVRIVDGHILPTIKGQAYVNGDLQVVFDPQDPFQHGLV